MKWLSFQLELVSFSDFENVPLSTHQAIAKSDLLTFCLKVVIIKQVHLEVIMMGTQLLVKGWDCNMVLSLLSSYKKPKTSVIVG